MNFISCRFLGSHKAHSHALDWESLGPSISWIFIRKKHSSISVKHFFACLSLRFWISWWVWSSLAVWNSCTSSGILIINSIYRRLKKKKKSALVSFIKEWMHIFYTLSISQNRQGVQAWFTKQSRNRKRQIKTVKVTSGNRFASVYTQSQYIYLLISHYLLRT